MTLCDENHTDPLLDEAADWLLRLQEAPRDARTAEEFETWLARSPEHARAWASIGRSWRLIGEVAPTHEAAWKQRNPTRSRRRLSRSGHSVSGGWRRIAGIAVVAACVAFLALSAPSFMLRLQADHLTGTAESRVITLADGSTVTLGADSAIAATVGSHERSVTLLAGEAFFEVRRDVARPFTVKAGEVTVAVLGTAFDVQLTTSTATVQLEHGSVDVGYSREGTSGNAHLAPGEMMRVDRQTGEMSRNPIAKDDIAAWRNGYLFVSDATIGFVAEQLQRYHPAWISVPDRDLAARRVTGLYDLSDPDRALRALVEPYGGRVRAVSPYLRILSRL